ncbi:hypothetical protein LCGC14_1503410 [marine sediment metagenome]|uniref:Uncharacterized protein n=1 Tax=marine sediment metagenome TaxID=412755 RepID=A0A0F9M4T8_9ZZZZ|nr:hypothetical protein [Pricia sp.]
MTIIRWILSLIYILLFTYALTAVLQPGDELALGVIAGTVLSLVLSYAPGVAKVYEGLSKEVKQAVNISLMALVAATIFVLSCANQLDVGVFCTLSGALDLLLLVLYGLIATQGIYGANNYLAERLRKRFAA